MDIFLACMDEYHVYAWYSQRPEESVGSLGLELQMLVSCHVAAGSESLVLWKSNQSS